MGLGTINGKKLGKSVLRLEKIKKLRGGGWHEFKLFFDKDMVIEGIYSEGGKGVKPWLDVSYYEISEENLSKKIFQYLGDIIPPGGHLMVSYEGEQKIHKETLAALGKGIPPAATSLGFLIFQAGFQYVKDWYLAEGGYEGPRKLWGEKAFDKKQEKILLQKTASEIAGFLKKNSNKTASQVFKIIKKKI